MAKGYVIEEIRASVRLRDPKSGSVIDVPLALGDHWTPPTAPQAEQAPARGEAEYPEEVPAAWVKAFTKLTKEFTKVAEESGVEVEGVDPRELARDAWNSWREDKEIPTFDELEGAFENTTAPHAFYELTTDLVNVAWRWKTSPEGGHLEDAFPADDHPPEQREPAPEPERRKRGRPRKTPEHEGTAAKTSDEPPTKSSATKTEAQPARKPRSDKGESRGKGRKAKGDAAEKHPDADTLTTPQSRARQIDSQSLSSEDANAWAKLQANLRHVRGRKGGKVGGLGWEETTDAGRSGLLARFGSGAYKILHAGADTYALFYEWDNGKYERLGCGNAEDLMNLATERARSGPPEAPPTSLGLELARLYCGNAQQKASAAERLEPAFREVDVDANKERSTPTPAREESPDPATPQPEIVIDAKMDQQLAESLKRALEEMEG